jgi:branched-chain amino acid transport system permease protein
MEKFIDAVLAGIAEGATYGLVALGVALVYKATRVINFAQAEIGTLSIYIAWELTQLGLPIAIATIIALVFAAIMGAGTEFVLRPLGKAPALTVTVATLGIATALGAYQIVQFGPDPHNLPDLIAGRALAIGSVDFVWGRVLAMIITLGLGLGLYLFLRQTLFGLGVLAAAQDQTALKLQGLPYNRVSMFVWSAGAVLSALAGIVLAPTIGAFTPFFITTSVLIPALAAALVGGLTSLPGAFVGGLAIGITQNLAKFYLNETLPGAEFVAVFGAVALVLLLRPRGLLGAEA